MSKYTSYYVRCAVCGEEFDLRQGGRRDTAMGGPVCPECLRRQGVQRTQRVKLQPGVGGTIAKFAVGLVFVVTALGMDDFTTAGVGIVMALALFAWALWPWLRMARAKSRAEKEAAAADERWRAELKAREEQALNERKICPSCGAPTKGRVCEYCGSPLK